ncbi:amidohydrolase [Corallococcus sp. H22C18031201]|uniref:amidohydrolase family protein n=1 Tax=Citreicoccus inhibens TaxID=2849499 RepID=UPI000E73552B|nr:amidohydrolase family protein [Citreicoccus inhibens]MBU8894440.1 amidohydrolase family protein [Citreicoccus inhibens]RJS16621.1 amidohydrolase [Corallococcus sp. H22C18031201]
MMKRSCLLLLVTACATVPPTLPDSKELREPAAPLRTWTQPRAVVVRHATVMPASGPAIADGAVAFVAGRLVAVGPNAEVRSPPGAEEVDGTGMYVTPGIIDAHSHLGVYSMPTTFGTDDGNEATAPVTAEVSAEHSFWPQDPGLRRAAAGGITSLLVLPGSANLIGGRGFPVKLHFGRSAAEMRFPGARDALKMACGENPRNTYGLERKVAPSTRMGNVAGYRQAFAQAREYLDKWDDWRRKHEKQGEDAGPAPLRDLKLETLAEVLRGHILVQNHCYRADEMAVMLQVAKEAGFQIRAFHHGLEAYKLRDTLAREQVAVATWADWWGYKMEAWDGIPENAGLVSQAGGRAVIHSDSGLGIQRLNQEAAKALWRARESGIPVSEEEALRWVTLHPAWVMGVDDVTGSLEPGKMADVVLWRGHPLSVYARAERVWADGVVTFDAATGPVDDSDFEVGALSEAIGHLVARPASAPTLAALGLTARCEAGQDAPCSRPLAVESGACTVFRGVTAFTGAEWLRDTTVVVDGGKVARVGAGVSVPAGCREVEGKGRVLTPGFVEPFTGLGLVEVLNEESTQDVSPRGDAAKKDLRAALQVSDSLNPASAAFPVARLGGVTSVVSVPAGGLVAGQSAAVDTDGRLRRASLALHVNLGLSGRNAVSGSRAMVLERLREVLFDAREYGRRKAEFDARRLRELAASRLDLEALQPVLAGSMPVVVRADRESDIRAALSLAREYNLKLVLAGGGEAWRVAPELAAARVSVILHPTQNLPEDFDRLSSRQDAAALLTQAGVKVLVSGMGEPGMVRTLAQEAGNAVAWGLPHTEALRAMTANVADAFNLDVGRIAPGTTADVVLWNGDPLEVSSRPLGMWLAGRQVSLVSRQQALLEKYRTLPR